MGSDARRWRPCADLVRRGGGEGFPIHEVTGWHVDRIEHELASASHELAALVVDPLMSRAGVIPAPDGVLAGIADACRAHGVLLLFDERISGFRVHRGGARPGAA